jgi:hypothetical protein
MRLMMKGNRMRLLKCFLLPLLIWITNRGNGVEWPGIFPDPAGISPVVYNIVDEEMLIEELHRAGFKVLKSKYIQKPFLENEHQYDGRDWLIAIAQKLLPYRGVIP